MDVPFRRLRNWLRWLQGPALRSSPRHCDIFPRKVKPAASSGGNYNIPTVSCEVYVQQEWFWWASWARSWLCRLQWVVIQLLQCLKRASRGREKFQRGLDDGDQRTCTFFRAQRLREARKAPKESWRNSDQTHDRGRGFQVRLQAPRLACQI